MSKFSTSFEPSPREVLKFVIACLALLIAISGIIFGQPILGIAGVVVLLVTVATHWRSSTD
jgi:hypothetical protein